MSHRSPPNNMYGEIHKQSNTCSSYPNFFLSRCQQTVNTPTNQHTNTDTHHTRTRTHAHQRPLPRTMPGRRSLCHIALAETSPTLCGETQRIRGLMPTNDVTQSQIQHGKVMLYAMLSRVICCDVSQAQTNMAMATPQNHSNNIGNKKNKNDNRYTTARLMWFCDHPLASSSIASPVCLLTVSHVLAFAYVNIFFHACVFLSVSPLKLCSCSPFRSPPCGYLSAARLNSLPVCVLTFPPLNVPPRREI